MATFVIDNSGAAGIQDLTYDQSAGQQTQITTDDGDEVDVTLDGATNLDGLSSGFETFLAGLGLSADQKNYAVANDAASSSSTFITVTADAGETLNDLKLLANSATALTGFQTLASESIYVHVDATGNYATLKTAGGRIVGAIALTDETIDNTTTHTATAGVQLVFFEAIKHTNTSSQDESVSLSDVLDVGVDTAVSFNFQQLDSGNFLWAAVGDGDAAMLITGQDLNVKNVGSPAQVGNKDTGNPDPCDTVNTSAASDTTIGILSQHFAPTNTGDGPTGVFTFVNGFAKLKLAEPQYEGQNVKEIDYDDYINVSSASIHISQLTGGTSAIIHLALWEAGGGGATDKAPGDLLPEEGYDTDPANKFSYIGDEANENTMDDTPVDIWKVEIGGFTWFYNDASNGTEQGSWTVTIDGNDVTVDGAQAEDVIKVTALNGASLTDGTFNRITIQAVEGSAAFDIGHIDLTSGGITGADLGNHLFVDDDGPKLDPTISANPNDLKVDNDRSAGDLGDSTDFSDYIVKPGTDGKASFTIVADDGTHTADSTGTFRWAYDSTTGANAFTSITGTYNDLSGAHNLYTLVLNQNGTYTFTMTGDIPGSSNDLNPKEVIKAGAPSDPLLRVGLLQNDRYVEMSADSDVVGANGNINESHGFVGVDNGNLDIDESLTFTLHEANGDPITFQGILIGTKSAQASTYSWTAELAGGGTISSSSDEQVGKNGTITIDAADLGGATIVSITIFKETGPATKIGIGDIHIITPPADVQLGFNLSLVDGDGDAAMVSFVVDIDADNDGDWEAGVNASSILVPDPLFSALSTELSFQSLHQTNHDLLML